MIGIFDSGVGGLSVVRAVRERLPSADILYFGDTAFAPYGSRSNAEIAERTRVAIELLLNEGVTSIIAACNSVSALLAVSIYDAFELKPTQVIEMLGPTVSYLGDIDAPMLLLATEATVNSGMYQNAFLMRGAEVDCVAVPELAGAIEQGEGRERYIDIIKDAIPADSEKYKVVVLGCTHYPLITDVFKEMLGDETHVFDPAIAVAARAKEQFWPQEVGEGTLRILASSESQVMENTLRDVFESSSVQPRLIG